MQMILFTMNQHYYVTAAEHIEEVIDAPTITKVPLADAWVEGLINLRGTVLTVVNLAELIGLEQPKHNRNILIMKKADEKKGLLIEEVIEVITIEEAAIQLPNTDEADYYTGVLSIANDVASIIDVTHLIF